MKKILLCVLVASFAVFLGVQAFARCAYYGPPFNEYRCFGDKKGTQSGKRAARQAPSKSSGKGCSQLDLTVSCAASGSAVDWINTCSLDCGDGNRYDALAVQKDRETVSCWHREVPPNRSCSVTVGSGFDSKTVGVVQTAGTCKQLLRGRCAW